MKNLNNSIASKGVQLILRIFLTKKTQAQIIFTDKFYQLAMTEIQIIPKLLKNSKSRALSDLFVCLYFSRAQGSFILRSVHSFL